MLAALILPYFINLGVSSLWDSNESFYAETPREMMVSGDYLAPQFNFQARAQKPPLTYWGVAAAYKLFGVSEFAVRLPGALAAAGVVLFTYGIARLLACPGAALFAAAIAATSPRFFIVARRLPIDILLLFFLTGTAFFLTRAVIRQSRMHWAFAYLFAALGFMTKGPVAVLIPAAAYVLWGLWARRFHFSSVYPWMGVLIAVAVISPWYALIYAQHGWTYIAGFFLKDNLGRFASQEFGPARGPLFYITTYLADFFPWSLLTPVALFSLWKNRRQTDTLSAFNTGFPLVWCAFIFIFFSFSRNKQEYYIASMYPVMAVLIAGELHRLTSQERPLERWAERGLAWTGFAVALVFLTMSVVLPLYSKTFLREMPGAVTWASAFVMIAAAALLTWSEARGMHSRSVLILSVSLWAMFTCFAGIYLPAMERYRPVRELCGVIARHAGPEDEVGYFRATTPSMVYYLRRPIFEEYDTDAMVRRLESPGRILCLMTKRDYDYIVETRNLKLNVLDRRPRLVTQLRGLLANDGASDLLLVSNRPDAGAGLSSSRIAP